MRNKELNYYSLSHLRRVLPKCSVASSSINNGVIGNYRILCTPVVYLISKTMSILGDYNSRYTGINILDIVRFVTPLKE